MGFYGNITDMSKTHFQFDKVFHNRTEMDNCLALGTDNIFAGRFVLVKYDLSNTYFQGDLLYGFRGDDPNTLYADKMSEHPYIFTTFTRVDTPSQEDCADYYYKDIGDNFYFKLPDASYYSEDDAAAGKYYIPDVENEDNIVSENKILQLKDETGKLLNSFYKCDGQTSESGLPAKWITIITDNDYQDYFINFQIDAATYGDNFDTRGYDGTVWQKVYSEGNGKFIPIARLNGTMPAFEFISESPSLVPTNPYIDAKSTDALYRIHVPSHWGFRIKEAESEINGAGTVVYPLSDETISQIYGTYDENNNLINETLEEINADIYFNKKANNRLFNYKDTTTLNKITIEPTGESGKTYYDKEGNPVTLDTYELSVHLPMIGNMISDGYDLIYGSNEEPDDNGLLLRPTDVDWYSGTATDELKYNGNSVLGGKTHNLNTIAGSLNTIHDIMGQIVVELTSWPNETEVNSLSSQYLYYYDGSYYRKGEILEKTLVSDFTYVQQTNVNENNFTINKYYQFSNNTYIPATEYNANTANNNGYYLKNINTTRYSPVSLVPFITRSYYVREGVNYICDNAQRYPTYQGRTYYSIQDDGGRLFTGEYISNGSFYTLDSDGNYNPSYSSSPEINVTYYNISTHLAVSNGLFYRPNCFYYKIDDNFFLETAENYDSSKTYYILIFDTVPKYGYNNQGEVVQYYEVIDTVADVQFNSLPQEYSLDNLYVLENGSYIPYENIKDITNVTNRDPYTIRRDFYTLDTISYPSGSLYLPGVYYIKDINNLNYTKSYASLNLTTTYYLISDIEEVEYPFYVPDKYYYEESQDIYILSQAESMTNGEQYYEKSSVYVENDEFGQCPYGYEWNDYAPYVPPSITLYTVEKKSGLIAISELGKNTNSLFGLLLQLNKMYGPGEEATRDIETVRGAYNVLRDMLYQIKTLRPGHLLQVNDFGQIESISLSDLKTQLANV